MRKQVFILLTMLIVCFFMPGIIQAKTAENTSSFEYEFVSEDENTCRITGIRITKDDGISELRIPDTINGKTVVSIGVGKKTNKWNEKVKTNVFIMHLPYDDDSGKWNWTSESKVQERRAKRVKKIILPDTIQKIRDYAFAGLSSLKSIKLSKSLATIGRCAFSATSIQKMHFPSSLTSIEIQLFFKSPIKNINIPANLKKGVAELARSKVSWKHFTVSKKNPYYKVEKGMLYSKDGKVLYAMIIPNKNIRIPDKVDTIDELVFYKASLQSVHLGAGVKNIKSCSLSTKTRCKVTLSPKNPYLARSGMCIYRKKKRELLVGIPKGRVFRISRKVKKLVADSISLVGIGKKYQVKKVYIPKSVETIEYGWGVGGFVHKNCRYFTERDYWTFQP